MEGNHIVGDTNLTIIINIPDDLKLVKSDPPSGKCKINNLYVDPDKGKQITEYDDTPS